MIASNIHEFLANDAEYTTLQANVKHLDEQIEERERLFRSAVWNVRKLEYIKDILQDKMFDIQNLSQKQCNKVDRILGEAGVLEKNHDILEGYLKELEREQIKAFVASSGNIAALEKLKVQRKKASKKSGAKWSALWKAYDALEKSEANSQES